MRPHYYERKLLGTTATGLKISRTKTPPSSPPPPTLPRLPDELIVEILLRLPVRSLLQFKSVCKSWETLISSTKFAKDHFLQRSFAKDPTPRLAYSDLLFENCRLGFCPVQPLLENPSAPPKVVSFSFETDVALAIVGSCNGLLCLHSRFCDSVRLWNPCTGLASEWFEIESSIERLVTYHGFGYDYVHDKYKLLGVAEQNGGIVTKVYTFGANSWATIQDFPFRPDPYTGHELSHPIDHDGGKYLSGTLNWITHVPYTANQWVIISFDLAKETYGQVFLPDMNNDNIWKPLLQVLRNSLCVCFDQKQTHWEVWLMKEYGVQQSWTKLVTISHLELRPLQPCFRSLQPLYISKDDVVLAMSPTDDKLVLYNSNDGWLHYPATDSLSYFFPLIFHVYHESLLSPSHCGVPISLYGLKID